MHWKDIRKYIVASKISEPDATLSRVTDPAWADQLNRHFASVGPDTAAALSEAASEGETIPPRPPRVCASSFRVKPATLPELSAALKQMGTSGASGVDGVTIHLIRLTFGVIAPHLLHIVNSSLITGKVSDLWKTANVTPLFKGGDQNDPNNYRPISILSVIGKLCERLVGNQLVTYLSKHHILSSEQHGFRPGHSTESAMLSTVNLLTNNIDRGMVTSLTTTDTSKAFDSVQHSRLLQKLGWYGIDTHWFSGWLEGRSQRVTGCDRTLPVTHGVIQGSILGPILFVLFTNDLPSFIDRAQLIMYADDAQFLDADVPSNVNDLRDRVETTLSLVLNWFTQNRLKINPRKTDLLLVRSPRLQLAQNFEVRFGSATVRPSHSVKVLGVTVDSHLDWERHISVIVQRCYSILVGLAKLSRQLPWETKKVIIEGLVHPHIIYCLTVWGGCSKTQKHRIQKALNFAARIITGVKRSDHISPALKTLGWLKIDELLTERDLLTLFRLQNSPNAPDGLCQLVVPRSDVSVRLTRGAENNMLQIPRVRTELARRSFASRAARAWNRLPREIRTSKSHNVFKPDLHDWLLSNVSAS